MLSLFKKRPKSVEAIKADLSERRPLPLGMTEFDGWSDRIIAAAAVSPNAESYESQKFALATMLLHLGPQEDFKDDAYFVHSLRKAAVNQIAHAKMQEIRDAAKARLTAQESGLKLVTSDATPSSGASVEVLPNTGIQKNPN